jgi:hypothetical protein
VLPPCAFCWLSFPPPNHPPELWPEPWPPWSPRCESNPDALPDWCDVFTVAACATL